MTASPSDARSAGADLRLLAPAAGCWLISIIGVVGGAPASAACVALCLCVVAAASYARRDPARIRWARVLLLVVATAGLAAGFGAAVTLRDIHVRHHPIAAADLVSHKVTVDVVIGDDPRAIRGPGPPRVRVPVDAALARSPTGRVAATLTAPSDGWSDLVPGQRVTAVVTVDRPYRSDLTAASLRASAPPQAVSDPPIHQVWASAVRDRFASLSRRTLPSAESGLLPGLVLGDVSGLGDDVADDFRRCGLVHLTAVSGANFAIICGTVLFVLQAAGVGRRPAAVIAAVALICFVVLVRPSPSVVRAAVMGVVGLIAVVAGRRSQAVPALGAAVIAVLGIWPALAVDPGFALSVCATAALIGLAPIIRDRLHARGVPMAASDLLAIALAAQIVTAPLVAMFAGTLNVVGVLANLAVVVAVAPITVLGTCAAVIAGIAAPVAEVLIRFCEPALWWMVRVADVLARIPGASVTVPDGVIGAWWVASGTVVVVVSMVLGWRWWRGEPMLTGRAAEWHHRVHDVWTVGVGRVWHDGRRDRSTAPPARRRRVPGRARHRFRPRRGARHGRRGSADHPGAGGRRQ